jgi:hypothetical protein
MGISHPNGGPEPFLVTRQELYRLFGSVRLTQRIIRAGWVKVVRRGKSGRETLFDFSSAKSTYRRLKNGEEPPLLPCETRSRKK